MKTKTILLGLLFSTLCSFSALVAQQRVLLHINKDGEQETIPLRKGETAKDVLSRLEKWDPNVPASALGTRDSMTNYGKNGATNFIASHQDVMFQWFDPQAGGYVLEFGWRNGSDIGTITKSTIRAWKADPRIMTLPPSAMSKAGTGTAGNMGYYIKSDDGDGLKTPFKNEATNTKFVKGKGDTSITFDPLGTEASWLAKGWQFSLVASAWQSFKLMDFGDSMKFNLHEPFGFTKQNDTKIGDIGGGDVNMLIYANSADQYPYHSLKFYEGTPASNYGWQIRDYEWNFYAIVMYTSDRPPKINSFDRLSTTLKTSPRAVTAKITDDNPGGGAAGVKSVDLFVKVNNGPFVKTSMTLTTAPTYTGTLPAANPSDTVTYYIVATDVNNLSTTSVMTSYAIFNITKSILFMWNGRSYPTGVLSAATMAQYGMMNDSLNEPVWYDVWDVMKYGTSEIPTLLKSYYGVVEATGDGGYADLTGYAGTWLSTGTSQNPKAYFLSDQDHGFIFDWDTSFSEMDPHNKYFGLLNIIDQDYPYYLNGSRAVTIPWRIDVDSTASANSIYSFISKYQKDNGVTLWYHPNYEWPPFVNWMDELRPKVEAMIVFRDPQYNKVIGVRKSAPDNSWHTTFLAFDYLGCDFRSDTSASMYVRPDKDPKYKKLINVGNLAVNFIKALTAVQTKSEQIPGEFSLSQNYPNPFNPVTNFRFSIADLRFVEVKVFDLLGREVATLVNERKPAGNYIVQWDATHFASGVYFYRLQAGAFSDTKKLLLLK